MTGEPSLCIRGCGFFSTSQNKNHCSKCYNDFLKEESSRYFATLSYHTKTATEVKVAEETEEATAVEVEKKKNDGRCKAYKKKVGILGFQCRCGHVFCGFHRYREEHSCPSDYKSAAINNLIIQIPKIKGDKLHRI